MGPSVSVVIPTHNRSDLLSRAVESVLDQTYQSLECIVVDDGSTDGTQATLAAYDDERLRVFRHDKSRGASAARNTGIDAAVGEHLAFLDDDDEWLPEKLAKQVPVLERSGPVVGLVYCWMDYYEQSGELSREYRPSIEGDIFPETLDGQPIGNSSTLLVRASVAEEVGGFDESLPRGNDGDFIRRVCRDYEVRCVREPLVKAYVDHGHERITRSDEEGIRNAITGHQAKLTKFETSLAAHPKRAANVYADIGFNYGRLGEWRSSAAYFRRAIATAPLSTGVYRRLFGAIRTRLTTDR